jgi:hypothetical protein
MASSNEVPKPSPELRLRPSHKWEGDSRCELIWRRVRRQKMWVMVSNDGHATFSQRHVLANFPLQPYAFALLSCVVSGVADAFDGRAICVDCWVRVIEMDEANFTPLGRR